MLIESTGAIQQASQATGTSFNYLLVESGLNPHAARRHRGRAGYSSSQRSDRQFGHGRSLHQGQRSVLSERLGRQPSEGELYIAHFLGAGGAARSITLASAHPNAKAADFFASAAQANSPISYDRATGAARSVAQVRNDAQCPHCPLRRRALQSGSPNVDGAGGDGADARVLPLWIPQALPTPSLPRLPRSSRATQRCFTDCFADANRTAPLARVVNALWRVPNAEPGTGATARRTPVANGVLDLFKDTPVKGS
jgi:hypothetical protein